MISRIFFYKVCYFSLSFRKKSTTGKFLWWKNLLWTFCKKSGFYPVRIGITAHVKNLFQKKIPQKLRENLLFRRIFRKNYVKAMKITFSFYEKGDERQTVLRIVFFSPRILFKITNFLREKELQVRIMFNYCILSTFQTFF